MLKNVTFKNNLFLPGVITGMRGRDKTLKDDRSIFDCIIILQTIYFWLRFTLYRNNWLMCYTLTIQTPYTSDLSHVFAGIREIQLLQELSFFFTYVMYHSILVSSSLSLWAGCCVSSAGEDICWARSSRTRAGWRWGGGAGAKGLWGRLVKPLLLPHCSCLNDSTHSSYS